jgi:hypothetical protein
MGSDITFGFFPRRRQSQRAGPSRSRRRHPEPLGFAQDDVLGAVACPSGNLATAVPMAAAGHHPRFVFAWPSPLELPHEVTVRRADVVIEDAPTVVIEILAPTVEHEPGFFASIPEPFAAERVLRQLPTRIGAQRG